MARSPRKAQEARMTEPAPAPAATSVDPDGLDLVAVERVRDGQVLRVDPVSANAMLADGRATLVDPIPEVDPELVATTETDLVPTYTEGDPALA